MICTNLVLLLLQMNLLLTVFLQHWYNMLRGCAGPALGVWLGRVWTCDESAQGEKINLSWSGSEILNRQASIEIRDEKNEFPNYLILSYPELCDIITYPMHVLVIILTLIVA